MRSAFVTGCTSIALRALLGASIVTPAAVRSVAAQDIPNREAALEIRKRFVMDLDTLQSKFLALSDAIPEGKYAWRPAPGVRSVGEVFMHVASEYYVYAPMSY